MDLVHIWYDDKYCSETFIIIVPTLAHDLKEGQSHGLRNFMLKFFCYKISLFPNLMLDLVKFW